MWVQDVQLWLCLFICDGGFRVTGCSYRPLGYHLVIQRYIQGQKMEKIISFFFLTSNEVTPPGRNLSQSSSFSGF